MLFKLFKLLHISAVRFWNTYRLIISPNTNMEAGRTAPCSTAASSPTAINSQSHTLAKLNCRMKLSTESDQVKQMVYKCQFVQNNTEQNSCYTKLFSNSTVQGKEYYPIASHSIPKLRVFTQWIETCHKFGKPTPLMYIQSVETRSIHPLP